MNGAIIALTLGYVMQGLLLLSLNLNSSWTWPIKAVAIGTALPSFLVTFIALERMMGWPSGGNLPEDFQLHAAVVEEPESNENQSGTIYLWLTPKADMAKEAALSDADTRPRAFALPYSRELHHRIDAMKDALNDGKLVAGRYQQGSPWERRFGEQDGIIDLYSPPPPPLPSKDG